MTMTRPEWLPDDASDDPTCFVHPADYPPGDDRERLKSGLAEIGVSLVVDDACPRGTVSLWDPLGHVKVPQS